MPGAAYSRSRESDPCQNHDVRSRVHRPRQWSTYLPEMYSVFNDHGNSAARQNRPESLLLTYIVFWGVLRGIFRGFSKNIFEKIKKSTISDAFASEITLVIIENARRTKIRRAVKKTINFANLSESYHFSASRKSLRCTIRIPFSIPVSISFSVTTYFG